jgi:catechol 2,3-dioxygenase-like lactoylglutathione lyase family enzyme
MESHPVGGVNMQFSKHVSMLLSSDVSQAKTFYCDVLGMSVAVDIGWFVSLKKDIDSQGTPFELSICAADHPSMPAAIRTPAAGTVLTFQVDDVNNVFEDLSQTGIEMLSDVRDEPWGQRHFYAAAPDGVALDIFQFIDPDPEWMKSHGFA